MKVFTFFSFGAIVFVTTLFTGTCALIKQILGSAILGDVIPALYSVKCISSMNNFTQFALYTRMNPDEPRPLVTNNWKLLRKSDYDASLPTKLIIHGFVDNMRLSHWMIKMKSALLREGDYNVIIVDWSCGNGFPYTQAVKNSKSVAENIADLVEFLQETRGAKPSDFHLIGHSLGSQIAAVVGNKIPHLGRISGLDPAGPKFYDSPAEYKLDPADANFVDVIHTDGGTSMLQGLGLHEQIGHVDFYPNGGKSQPGCHSSPLQILPRIGLQRAARYYLTCDHFRAVEYYIESIGAKKQRGADIDCQYVGVRCRDWANFATGRCGDCEENPEKCAPMGFYSDKYYGKDAAAGTKEFYLKTSEAEPFCVHQYQVIFETGRGGGGFAAARQRSDTTFNTDDGLSIRKIYLEVKTELGKIAKLTLNDRNGDILNPKKKHTYLATSKFPLGDVEEASIWWGSEEKPNLHATENLQDYGFSVKSVEIVPIRLQPEAKPKSLKVKRTSHLCGNDEKIISRGQYVSLSSGEC